MFIFESDRPSTSRIGAEREGDTESKAGSRLWAVSTEPDAGLEPTDHEIVTWAGVRHLTHRATQAPQIAFFFTARGCKTRTTRNSKSDWSWGLCGSRKTLGWRNKMKHHLRHISPIFYPWSAPICPPMHSVPTHNCPASHLANTHL